MADRSLPHDQNLVFAVVEARDARLPALREQLLDTWVAVTNAGGAVGFTPPADAAAIAANLDERLDRVAAGTDVLSVLRRDGAAVGMGFLVDQGSALRRHWRTVLRLMVRPELQGVGAGRLLLEGLHRTAAGLGLEQLQLTVRGGTGVEKFYERFGYTVVGRHPGAIRLAPRHNPDDDPRHNPDDDPGDDPGDNRDDDRSDDRDEIMLVAWL